MLHKAQVQPDETIPRVRQVLRQTRERILRGNTKAEGKPLSIFEAHTEVILTIGAAEYRPYPG